MERRVSVRQRSGVGLKPVAATLVGIPAAAIVIAAASGSSLPLVGSGRGPLIALWILGSWMCGYGIAAMRDRYGLGRATLIGLPLGLVNTVLILSALFGWSAVLQPIADALGIAGEPAALDRAAMVAVGVVMTLKWTIAWLAYLPRTMGSSLPTAR
jgi:hypothetical protein